MMEALYGKLLKKYRELKEEKQSEVDKLNRDQEEKFLNYSAAADEMIQYLTSEIDKLRGQVDDLTSELASTRYNDKQEVQYQKLLEEEKFKNMKLSEEIARLQSQEHNNSSLCTMNEEIRRGQENSHDGLGEGTPGKYPRRTTRKRKVVHMEEGITEFDRPSDQRVYGDKCCETPPNIQQPACCQRKIPISSGGATDTSSVNCVFQHLVEFVVELKLAPVTESNELSIMAHHQSSGYSFSLTWITNYNGETELVYHVLSLGTLESFAPEWMKETIMFSTQMLKIFFERISRVIKTV